MWDAMTPMWRHCNASFAVQIWMTKESEPTEAPEAQAIATIQFIILGIVMALFVFLDTFTVYDNLKYAWENIQDFMLTCREFRDRRRKKDVKADGVAVVYAADGDADSEQKKPLYDGDGGGSTSTGTPMSHRRLGSDSDPASDSGSVIVTPRPSASERRRMRSMSTSSEASIPGTFVPKRKHKKPPKPKERSKMTIGILAIRKRAEPVKKKKKKRPRLRPLLLRSSSGHDSESSRRPSGIQEDIVEEDPKAMAMYDMADPRQSSVDEGSSATGSVTVAPVELKSKPPSRQTTGKGLRIGRKKSSKRKSAYGRGKGRGKRARAGEKTGRGKTWGQLKRAESRHSVLNNLSVEDDVADLNGDSGAELELGASAAQLHAGKGHEDGVSEDVELGHTSASKFHGDTYDYNIDIQHNLDFDDKDTMTIKAKRFRDKLANMRPKKKRDFNIDKKYLIEPSRPSNARALNIPSTIPETDIYYSRGRGVESPARLITNANDMPEGVIFEQKTSLLSRVSHGVKRKLHELRFPGCAEPVVVSDEPVMLHPPEEISPHDGPFVGNRVRSLTDESYPAPIKGANFTRAFLEREFSETANMKDEIPPITMADVKRMYNIKLPGEEVNFNRGYMPPSSRYLDNLRSSGRGWGTHGRVPLKSWETAGIINPELVKSRISLAEEGSGTISGRAGLDNYGLDLDLTMAENIADEYPWQLKPGEGDKDYRQGYDSLDENDHRDTLDSLRGPRDKSKLFKFQPDRMSDAKYHIDKGKIGKHQMPSDLEEKFAVEGPPMDLSSPSGTSSDGSTQQLIFTGHNETSFLRRIPGVAQIHRLLSSRHEERMCYNVEEGHLENVEDKQMCPHPSRLVATLGHAMPKFRWRPGLTRSGSKDTLDIPDSGHDQTRPNMLQKLFRPCHNKRYSLDDTCVETIAKNIPDIVEEPATQEEPLYENEGRLEVGLNTSEDTGNDSDFSSYYRAPLPKY